MQPEIDFVAHAASMGAHAEKAADIADLEAQIVAARGRAIPSVIVIDTEAVSGTGVGGHWWDVAVPQVGGPERLEKARERYDANAASSASSTDPAGPGPVAIEGRQMPQLLRRPFGAHGKVHEITPASAGWRYVGFSLYRLRAGETVAEATGDSEVILVMVEGKAAFTAAGQDWGVLGERMDVFEKTPPHCLYLPNGTDWTADGRDRLRHRGLLGARQGRPRRAPDRPRRDHPDRARQGHQHPPHQQHRHGERGLLRLRSS